MIKIQINIEVLSHDKVIEIQKGKLVAMGAKLLPNAHQIVEKEIYEIIKSELETLLINELGKKGVVAKVSVN